MSQFEPKHNLNIFMYSFEEILKLFDLTYHITPEDLKRAKKQVLMLHPDKSKLSSDYFLFYKKALDMVLEYYQNNHKMNQAVTQENTQYDVSNVHTEHNKATERKIASSIQEMKPAAFQEKFNQLFEKNMVSKKSSDKNDWFKKEDPLYRSPEKTTQANLNASFENIKQQQQGMILYQEVTHLYSSAGAGTNLYEDLDEDEEASGAYISSDPFSKLKFDDLRKVHKDQTVFAVSEKDLSSMKTYQSVEQMNRDRGSQDLTPLKKEQSEKWLAEQEKAVQERMAQKRHESALKTKQYEEKNKSILSTFLRLT